MQSHSYQLLSLLKFSCQVPVNYLRRNKPFAFAEPSTQLRKVNVGPNGLYQHTATVTLHLVSSVDKKFLTFGTLLQ